MPFELLTKGRPIERERIACPGCSSNISVTYDIETREIVSSTDKIDGDKIICLRCDTVLKWTPPA